MTLTQAAILTRRGIIIFFLTIFLGISAKIGYTVWQNYYLSTLPPVEEKAAELFGPLPPLKFPPIDISSTNYSYSIDTTTGGLTSAPKLVKVYFIPLSKISLLTAERAKELAEKLGFLSEPTVLSTTEYKFTNEEGSLNIDLTSGNFSLQKTAAPSAQKASPLPEQDILVTLFKNYLLSKNLLPEELQNGRSMVIYNKKNQTDSNAADISLWPTDINNFPLVTANFKESTIKATVVKTGEESNQLLSIDYYFWPIDQTTSSTYEIKTAEEAFDDLQKGLGYIALQSPNSHISITSSYLAYYQSKEYSPYLQPVFVFEGPQFAAVVPAVKETTKELSPGKI